MTPTVHSALVDLLGALKARRYQFVTVGNATHATVLGRDPGRRAVSLRDVFGWSLAFDPDEFEPELLALLQRAGCLVEHEHGLCSAIRVSSLSQDLLIHSRWPTHDADSVFLGPDTYRFAAFIEQAIGAMPPGSSIVDVGAGSGAGGIVASRLTPSAKLMLCDTNRRARAYARANLEAAGLPGQVVESDGLDAVAGEVDLIVANPPFMAGRSGLTYCDGGDLHGAALSLDWCKAAFSRLAPGGRMLLYTGATIIEGRDEFRTALQSALEAAPQRDRLVMTYREIDPDIFGSELARAAYADAERIAAVGVQIQRLR